MDTDDLEPQGPNSAPAFGTIPDLEEMSLQALGEYIEALKAEIKRVKAEIVKKQGVRGAAEDLFKNQG